ncbi:MAG: hypothetical protein ISR84_03325 [Kiritimatiellales bacterium]|nr:hypothetical protein [Kiritimatiellales bacterium]
MKRTGQSRVVGLLGVGFDHQDGLVRITQADDYKVLMGSKESHTELQKICNRIDEAVVSSGRVLSDYTPEEFMELVAQLY